MDELEYITTEALMICDQGAAPDYFKPTYNTTLKVHGCLVATEKDGVPLIHIPSFKICKKTQKPCRPMTAPDTWEDTWDVKVKGAKSLIGKSTCPCNIGGTIEFMTSGQVPLPPEAAAELQTLQDQAQRELDDSGYGDSVGETGFLEGMVPVWGSSRDLVNDIQTGDGWGIAMNGGFLAWDVVSIGVGIPTLGVGTALMQAGKASLKGSIRTAARLVSREALEQLGKAAFRNLSKEALEKSVKEFGAKLFCTVVRACFTGETLIHCTKGLKPIKDIKIGDEVFSYDEEQGKVTLRKVTHLFEEEVEEVLELTTKKEIIRTTRNHPFYVNGQFKDAEQITIGEYLLNRKREPVKVISLNYVPEKIKVYNFEVEENHCYFVGKDGVLVLNVCPKILQRLAGQVPDSLKGIFKCEEFAIAYKEILQKEGINGVEVFLRSDTGFITNAANKVISENGEHVGIKVGDLIFDNLNPNGIPYEKWLDDLGVGFPGMNPPTMNPF